MNQEARTMGTARVFTTWAIGLLLLLIFTGCQSRVYHPTYTPPPPPLPAPPPQAARPTLYVTVPRLNLRACPGMDCPKIASLDRNEEVEKVGESDDWTQIRVKKDGTIGWVSSRYLSAVQLPSGPEVTPPPTPPAVVAPQPSPEAIKPPPLPPAPVPAPPAAEKAAPPKPGEGTTPVLKRKPEETKPAKAVKPPKPAETPEEVEESEPEPVPRKRAVEKKAPPVEEKPAATPPPPAEKPAPPPEQPKGIRIM